MSIERSHVASSHKPAAGAPATPGKSQGLDAAGDAGGFSGLLLTLGAADTVDATSLPVADAGVPGDPVPALDASVLLAQSVQIQPDAQIGEAKLLGTEAGVKRAGATIALAGGDAVQGHDTLRSKTQPQTAVEVPVIPPAESEARLAFDAAIKGAQKDANSVHSASHKAALADDNGKSVRGLLETRAQEQKLKATEQVLTQGTLNQPQLSQIVGATDSGLKQTERAKERLALKQVGDSDGGAWGYQALAEAGRIQAPSETGASAALSPEMQVAEQVHYWIGRDVQNAELRLEGPGEGTVKVNISMQGNEASVEFRSDQIQTRQVLEGAVSHLKDLLGSEGLVLSSVSVGSSGSGGAGARHALPAQPARTMRVGTVSAPAAESAARGVRSTGRAVDLFV